VWGALDTRRLYRHVVAAGTLYTLAMTTEVCEELGLATVPREVTPGLRPVMEIAGVDSELIDWSSTRRQRIEDVGGVGQQVEGRGPAAGLGNGELTGTPTARPCRTATRTTRRRSTRARRTDHMSLPVLVIAANDDWPTDRVVTELTGRGVEVFRMDAADFPQQISLTGRIDRGHGWAGELATVHRAVDLSRVGAVYYRAPGAFQFPDGMSEPEVRFAAAQARANLGGVVSALDCRWVNHPTFMARAEYKPVQLDAARSCGLRIPPHLDHEPAGCGAGVRRRHSRPADLQARGVPGADRRRPDQSRLHPPPHPG
jgi:hypothetical protein